MYYLASTYGSSSYDSGNYNGTNVTTGSGSGSSGANGGSTTGGTLSNTGFDIALIAGIACLVALAAMVVRIWKRPAKPTAQTK